MRFQMLMCQLRMNFMLWSNTGLILGLHPANERRRYKVTPSLIGWAQTYNQPRNSTYLYGRASEERWRNATREFRLLNTLRPEQNDWHVCRRKCIFVKKNCVLFQISWILVPGGPIENDLVLAPIMAWFPTCDKPFPETTTPRHFGDVIMSMIASQITSLTIVYSTVYSDADQRNIKAPRHWPLCGEFTGDRWILRTNGQ